MLQYNYMKRKTIVYALVLVLLLSTIAVATSCIRGHYHKTQQQTYEKQKLEEQEHEKKVATYAIEHLNIMKKAVESYIKRPGDSPKFDILLNEILKLEETDLSYGKWDGTLGVYTTNYFVYLGGCYSTWCYIQANRKNNSYTLYLKHDGTKWSQKRCSTELTELGRLICKYLEPIGWEYVEGEI
ncbi:MAG: hypothetical protein J6U96_00970 [Elusimicrobiaceae bacterium]|nr:hypothetical protein [Elusimicrobiaceae bacterium]